MFLLFAVGNASFIVVVVVKVARIYSFLGDILYLEHISRWHMMWYDVNLFHLISHSVNFYLEIKKCLHIKNSGRNIETHEMNYACYLSDLAMSAT